MGGKAPTAPEVSPRYIMISIQTGEWNSIDFCYTHSWNFCVDDSIDPKFFRVRNTMSVSEFGTLIEHEMGKGFLYLFKPNEHYHTTMFGCACVPNSLIDPLASPSQSLAQLGVLDGCTIKFEKLLEEEAAPPCSMAPAVVLDSTPKSRSRKRSKNKKQKT
eukprot:gnl/Spiro4/7530_TR3941_c0_g1_i1.p1 gnl/Spiro4/7530_TR3941_c0_g1~~gnl/Spiro4/7530_TR3941_c0_g1_i1.p1  ORF type:complete len:160 (+),score=17.60 gnl/Spiro4/7530_TR3941_c0_g1_i1:80-559(+)